MVPTTRSLAWCVAIILVSGLPSVVCAQETLTLERAVAETIAHNRSLEGARAGAREADSLVSEARAAFFPRVSFVESWQRSNQPVFVFSSLLSARQFGAGNFSLDALNSPDPIGYFHGAFGVEQRLFDGGRVRATVTSAELQRDMARLSVDDASAGLALTATRTYGRVLAAQAARRAADAAIAAAREDLARAERRRDAGTVTDADVLTMAVHLADVRQRSIQVSGDAAIARAELNRLMGASIDREYDVQEPTTPATAPDTTSAGSLLAEAETSRPDLRRAAAGEQLAEAGRHLARSAWSPEVAVQAGYELNGIRFADRASSWGVGGELRWSLSAGGAESARARAAADAVARAQLDREDARAAVQVEIVSARRRLESAQAREVLARASIEQARESQRIIRDRFEAGLVGANDVLRASAAVLDTETQRVSATVDIISSRAMLDRALGRKP